MAILEGEHIVPPLHWSYIQKPHAIRVNSVQFTVIYNCNSVLEVNTSDTVRRAYHMNCPLNGRRLPEDDNSVSEIITEYADNQVIIRELKTCLWNH